MSKTVLPLKQPFKFRDYVFILTLQKNLSTINSFLFGIFIFSKYVILFFGLDYFPLQRYYLSAKRHTINNLLRHIKEY